MLDPLGELRPLAQLHMKPPQQNSSRGELDQAVRPKRDQREAVRSDARTDRARGLDQHPHSGKPLKADGSADQIGA